LRLLRRVRGARTEHVDFLIFAPMGLGYVTMPPSASFYNVQEEMREAHFQ